MHRTKSSGFIVLGGAVVCSVLTLTAPVSAQRIVDTALSEQDVTIIGGDMNDELSTSNPSSIAVGDFNGDGVQDILVGSQLARSRDNERGRFAGEAYIFFGSVGISSGTDLDIAEGHQDITIFGDVCNNLAISVGSGDVNGDGIDDALIGAPGAFTGVAPSPGSCLVAYGETYVFFGSTELTPGDVFDIADGDQDLTIRGGDPFGRLGSSIAAGDVNGDSVADIIVAAWGANETRGEIYVVFGSTDLAPGDLIDLGSSEPALTIIGRATGYRLGDKSVTAADINADGFDDVLSGGRMFSGYTPYEAIVVFGSANIADRTPIRIDSDQHDLNIGGLLGVFTSAGDFNGDGVDDLIIGSDGLDSNRGKVFVFFGSADLLPDRDLSVLADDQDVTIVGVESPDRFGISVAAGDFDADGVDDVFAGAIYAGGPENSRYLGGEAYVVFGTGGPTPGAVIDVATSNHLVRVLGAATWDWLGGAVAGGDVNGDGSDDLIVGARLADGPDLRGNSGKVYVVFGTTLVNYLIEELGEIIQDHPGTQLAHDVEKALDEIVIAVERLEESPPDAEKALENIEHAVWDLCKAIRQFGLDPVQGNRILDQLVGFARGLAVGAIESAVSQGGDPGAILDAQTALAAGDALSAEGKAGECQVGDCDCVFLDAVGEFSSALDWAESAFAD